MESPKIPHLSIQKELLLIEQSMYLLGQNLDTPSIAAKEMKVL